MLLSALVVGIAVAILMESSVLGPRHDPGLGQPTGYGAGGPPPLKPREFVINATMSNGGFPVLPVAVAVAILLAGVGSWLFLRSRHATT